MRPCHLTRTMDEWAIARTTRTNCLANPLVVSLNLVASLPFLAFLALFDHLIQIGFQISDILLVLGPLLLGQVDFLCRQLEGALDTEITFVVQLWGQATDGFFYIGSAAETIVVQQTYESTLTFSVQTVTGR